MKLLKNKAKPSETRAICGLSANSQQTAAGEVYDIVLNGGRVVDPETGLDAVRNVGINAGTSRKKVYEIFQQAADFKAPGFAHVRRRPVDADPGMAFAVAQEIITDAAVTGAPLQLVHVTSTGLGDAPTIISMIEKAQEK